MKQSQLIEIKGKTFDQIAEWLNKKGYLSVRGKKMNHLHFHSEEEKTER